MAKKMMAHLRSEKNWKRSGHCHSSSLSIRRRVSNFRQFSVPPSHARRSMISSGRPGCIRRSRPVDNLRYQMINIFDNNCCSEHLLAAAINYICLTNTTHSALLHFLLKIPSNSLKISWQLLSEFLTTGTTLCLRPMNWMQLLECFIILDFKEVFHPQPSQVYIFLGSLDCLCISCFLIRSLW